ncbi:MAG: nucleotidyltransferase family protein [Dehalococcoidia bacterium]
MAGGRGERLKPLTDNIPKPMLPVNGRPMISHQVEWMVANGVTDVVFLCGYKGQTIQEYFGDGSRFGFNAHYSFEREPLGRGGAVRKGLGLVPSSVELVLVTNGDNMTNQPVAELVHLHHGKNALATMMLVPFQSPYGVVEVDNESYVSAFIEKGRLPFWINAGVYVFAREIEDLLPEVGDHETTTFQELAAEKRMAALQSEALWLTVDSPKELREVDEKVRSGALTLA